MQAFYPSEIMKYSIVNKLVPCGRRRRGIKDSQIIRRRRHDEVHRKINVICRYMQMERKCDIHTGDVVDRPATRQNIFLRKASISVDSCGPSSFTRSVVLLDDQKLDSREFLMMLRPPTPKFLLHANLSADCIRILLLRLVLIR